MALFGYIQITRNCNQKCRFCSNPPSGFKDLSFEKIKRIIDRYINKKYQGVILTGGEPTLHKDLFKIIEYCRQKNFSCKLITNGQKLKDKEYVEKLVEHGLQHFHISIYSHRKKIQAYLTQNPHSFDNLQKAFKNLSNFVPHLTVNVNITINKYNADHLSKLVRFIVEKWPFVNHFVFNNLDPISDRCKKNFDTIPQLNDFHLELIKSLQYLEKNKKTFRVERVPLCYLPGFEWCSTETRKIVKSEKRPIYFLDKKGFKSQKNFFYQKAPVCAHCKLFQICAGLYQMDKYYNSKELYPVFIDPNTIISKILNGK